MNYNYSVIIPCYDAIESDFRKCLNSIKAQTIQPYEVICIDDASPTSTPQIAKEYGYTYIRYDINKQNGGARNTGVRYATGDYLVFINSDNYVLPNYLEEVEKVNKGQDVIYIGLKSYGGYEFEFVPNAENTPYLSQYSCHGEPLKVVKRKFWIENELWQQENIAIADIEWNTRLEKVVKNYTFVPKVLYYYQTGHATSLCTKIRGEQKVSEMGKSKR